MQELIEKAAVLIEALPYIQQFRDSVVVVKFGGSAMEKAECTRSVIRDVVFMECAGMRPAVVHGGGKAITARLAEEGIETRFVNGLRYTCSETIRVVDDVLHNQVNADLVRMMSDLDGKPHSVSGKNVLRAERATTTDRETGEEEDLGFVGRVVNVDTEQLRWILGRREVPVITPLGRDMSDRVFNINADMAACEIAAEIQADKLVFLSDVPGLMRDPDDPGSLIPTVRRGEIEGLIEEGVISGGMVPKVRSAAAALDAGTKKVHMIDGRVQHSLLLEIFTDQGIGTQIIP
ncbi:MAG: acetylglutamate kinase [Lentisphaerae bacterium]|nr:acetylglutamate kinase [Lentisphaerota bacterium]MBT4816210.1 acetylglutamate kinase [Lentisphaerota bacterium]MBT5610313.1 acetylglutamate kinase [Lentisphaerota bacterium]MBT7056396.1 acetylglutamate kinase [Lentisphaerota bacterium]MBT7848232.1 acetylglutamate kinase [Lentisphaerota bacterium]